MPKVGRNDPCPCGSGKKYKHCHLPIEEAAQAEQLRLRRSVDTLMAKIVTAAQEQAEAIPAALDRFWNGKYAAEQLDDLDDLEGRGAERFLTWFAFDYPLAEGRTLIERLAAGEGELEMTDEEARLLEQWVPARLRPYAVLSVAKGQGMRVRDLLDEAEYEVEDHAASRRILSDEVLVAHLVPAGRYHYIGGAAAHLTEDTREKLREFAALHLEAFQRDRPGADAADMLREKSEVLNHFVMQLPTEEPNPSLLEQIVQQTRVSLRLAGESLGIGRKETPEEPSAERQEP
jgi:hypothetical protein